MSERKKESENEKPQKMFSHPAVFNLSTSARNLRTVAAHGAPPPFFQLPRQQMPTLPFYLVDAFVRGGRAFTGNGAGVVLLPAHGGGVSDAAMQAAAAEIKQVRLLVCVRV